jgi:sugar lactone lactonase YvrE
MTSIATLPTTWLTGELELVATIEGPMPTGVTVSHDGRVFVCFPRWGDYVSATVAEITGGPPRPYPDSEINRHQPGGLSQALVCVQSVVVDPANRLWLLDAGSIEFGSAEPGGPKLVCVDLGTDEVIQTITFPREVAGPDSYLNDVRFDLRRGEAGIAYITDSSGRGPNGIVVADLASGQSWRKLHEHPSTKADRGYRPLIEGWPLIMRKPDGTGEPLGIGSDGIAISADGSRLYYCPFLGRRLYSVATDALADEGMPDDQVAATVRDEGDKGGGSDGLESDAAGNVYLTSYEHSAVLRRRPDGMIEPVVIDPRLTFPDTLSLARNQHLYIAVNQYQRQKMFWGGEDRREPPYAIYRVPVGADPVLLGSRVPRPR